MSLPSSTNVQVSSCRLVYLIAGTGVLKIFQRIIQRVLIAAEAHKLSSLTVREVTVIAAWLSLCKKHMLNLYFTYSS